MGKMERDKGARFEREVAVDLRPIFPRARRGYQRFTGQDEPDVAEVPPFWIECRHRKKVSALTVLKLAEKSIADRGAKGKMPVAVTKVDRDVAMVSMRLDDWLEVIEAWWRHESEGGS
jgi:hypothetical protein